MQELGQPFFYLTAAFCLSAAGVALLSRLAPVLRLLDAPGARKVHSEDVPLVGGLAIFATLIVFATFIDHELSTAYFALALSIVVAMGLWDDVADISPRLKFVIQIVASAVMIWGAEVVIVSVGNLLGWRPIGLWLLSVPVTIFAVVGVVNAVNMIDGLDGLAGSIALVALLWYALAAQDSGLQSQFKVCLVLAGAIGGFLLFNLRFPWQLRARVFLGDAGSLAMGFALAWLAIDLTQGPGRTFPPIAALWIVLLPLADCVSLMIRRMARRRSPFLADSRHIHHYLLAVGFSHTQALWTLVTTSTILGAVGYSGWRLGASEAMLFWPFFFGFFAYHHLIQKAWERLDRQRATSELSALDEKSAATAPQ